MKSIVPFIGTLALAATSVLAALPPTLSMGGRGACQQCQSLYSSDPDEDGQDYPLYRFHMNNLHIESSATETSISFDINFLPGTPLGHCNATIPGNLAPYAGKPSADCYIDALGGNGLWFNLDGPDKDENYLLTVVTSWPETQDACSPTCLSWSDFKLGRVLFDNLFGGGFLWDGSAIQNAPSYLHYAAES